MSVNTSIQTVYLGYTTSVYLFNKQTPIFCTSLSFTINQQIITSSGSFLGALNISNNDTKYRASGPIRLDYPDINASVSFQVTLQYLDQLLAWIKNRQSPRELKIKVGTQDIKFEQCYWTSIGLNVSQGQLLTCSISMLIRDKYAQRNIKKATENDSKLGTGSTTNTNLGKMYSTAKILPYYATGVKFTSTDVRNDYVTGWSIDLNQNLIKKTYCVAQKYGEDAPLPKDIMVGNMNASVKITVLNAGTAIPLYKSAIDAINFNGEKISQTNVIDIKYLNGDNFTTLLKFGYNMLQSVAPAVSQQSSLQQIQYTYTSYKIMY